MINKINDDIFDFDSFSNENKDNEIKVNQYEENDLKQKKIEENNLLQTNRKDIKPTNLQKGLLFVSLSNIILCVLSFVWFIVLLTITILYFVKFEFQNQPYETNIWKTVVISLSWLFLGFISLILLATSIAHPIIISSKSLSFKNKQGIMWISASSLMVLLISFGFLIIVSYILIIVSSTMTIIRLINDKQEDQK